MSRLGIADREAFDFVRQNPEAQSVSRQLRPGKIVTAKTGENSELHTLYFPLNGKDSLLVIERHGNGFAVSEQALKLEAQTVIKSGEIRSSLFGATDAAGIPDAIAMQLAEIFGGDIDFHRDLRKGDRFSLVYEVLNHRGQAIRSGRILSAEFSNNQRTFNAHWFQAEEGKGGYYTEDGKSLRKAFLRSPLEFSRVTSGFTNARFHPVLQTWRAHKGVDYGAPTGTKVRAVADGTVEVATRQGGYGNLIILRHQGTYSTAYGHLSGFGTGIRKGARVNQGDTIGYVGQTGLASGPHLHYEFRVNSQQVNPLAVTLPTAIPLEASQLSRYKNTIAPLRAQLQLAKQIQLASIE
jgi:murein DD-endopeptidase MepM/ murein hydrolase activator NlpD